MYAIYSGPACNFPQPREAASIANIRIVRSLAFGSPRTRRPLANAFGIALVHGRINYLPPLFGLPTYPAGIKT
jgi:hypothetical protein